LLPRDDHAVLVLGAGRGTRMGGPKVAMDVGGRPWCHWQRERIERLGLRTLWVLPPGVRDSEKCRDALDGLEFVTGDPDSPMFASFVQGLNTLAPEHGEQITGGLFVLPIDTPAPKPDVWRRLAAASLVGVPTHRGTRGHPVFLSWPWVARVFSLGAGAEAPPRAARLDRLIEPDTTLIEVDDPDVAVNLNTPDDVAHWLAQSSGPEGGA